MDAKKLAAEILLAIKRGKVSIFLLNAGLYGKIYDASYGDSVSFTEEEIETMTKIYNQI